MNAASIKKIVASALILAAVVVGSGPVLAASTSSQSPSWEDWLSGISLVYVDTAFGPAIHSYQNLKGIERKVDNPQIVYVNQAYGQAIYSYPRVARDTVLDFNLHYVDQGHGQAIYSYPGLEKPLRGEVTVSPVVPIMPE
jgi:hypothetical protein